MRLFVILTLFCSAVHAGPVTIYGLPTGSTNPTPVNVNASGQITTTLGACEDETNGVCRTEQQFSVCIDDADKVCKATAGFLHSVWCYEEDAAPTAGTVRITNTAAAGGAETTEVWGKDITTTVGSGTGTAILDIVMDTGIVIDFTTTADVKCGVSYR